VANSAIEPILHPFGHLDGVHAKFLGSRTESVHRRVGQAGIALRLMRPIVWQIPPKWTILS
jgi:hypothetical protein